MKVIKIEDLIVNKENPRHQPVLDEEGAIIELCHKKDKMSALIESISKNGYYEQKVLSVIKTDDGKYVALDGNRRLAAIKLMHDNSLAPQAKPYESFRKKLSRHTTTVTEVNCVVYDDLDAAVSFLLETHTEGSEVEKWNLIQQYRFKIKYGNNKIPVFEALLKYCKELDSLENVSTLESRVFNSKVRRDLISLKDDGTIPRKFVRVFLEIVGETCVKNAKRNSRNLPASEAEKYIKEKIDKHKKSTITKPTKEPDVASHTPPENPSDVEISRVSTNVRTPATTERTKSIKNRNKYFIDVNHSYHVQGNTKINEIIDELTKLDLTRFRHAASVLYRTFIDCSLVYFGKKKSFPYAENESLASRVKKTSNHLLGTHSGALGDRTTLGAHKNIATLMKDDPDHILNGIVHDIDTLPNIDSLLGIRDALEPLFDKLFTITEDLSK